MKKKTKKDFEAYVFRIIKKYIPVLFLQRNTFEVEQGTKDKNAYFEARLAYPYLNQKILYSDEAIKDYADGKDMTPFIVHEICHAVTDPFYYKATERYVTEKEIEHERELLTDHVCNIVLRIKK